MSALSPVPALDVLATGPLATVQDAGRPGLADIGVGASGAADRAAYRLANRLVANDPDAAAVEITFGGFTARARGDLTVAVTGAACPVEIDGRGAAVDSVLRVPAGAELRLGAPTAGLRCYLAVRGGIDVEPVLGSRATDLLAGLGPPELQPGSVLPAGRPPAAFPTVDLAPVPAPPEGDVLLHAVAGPRADWFTEQALEALSGSRFEVTAQSNRIGMRLDGPDLPRARTGELPSEGMVPGALQVPPSARPTLFLADHPVTGGYPVIAVLRAADVARAAQVRPGQHLRFRVQD
ncbi:biotin-dependent carboxyltransferase family protein [Saccharopolyspora sp. HNM0983]|uniref:Biotin-dependent carboxyltransferase family protein n=1 Tax=Saccharopolyspora montiporae TaxID=2781240 RepID=A0A929B7G1_9PSEU|nr:biotin-dependent carboxyltransferase family protein [Saccharopolyspora sp. HNM0983]MBE9374639.1 biotin-dependent carboxyltransferase family protein [Saccharopolyspora sp. HNM0983]